MDIILSAGLLILAGSMVILFAMMGELASTVKQSPSTPGATRILRPLEGAPLGRAPREFPPELSRIGRAPYGCLIALSTSCKSCSDLAPRIREKMVAPLLEQVALIIACPREAAGEEFVMRHELQGMDYWIDPGGHWLRTEVGIESSPTFLLFSHGTLRSALAFSDVDAMFEILKSLPDTHRTTSVTEVA